MFTRLLPFMFCLLVMILSPLYTEADEINNEWSLDGQTKEQKPQEGSNKADNSKRFLPGEEIKSESGKRVKIWSTEGPVPVSRAPEPFEDREKTVLPEGGLILDLNKR